MKQYLIADSGGTKTDWCLINANGGKKIFTTESYHPFNWSDSFFQRIETFWERFENKDIISLYFFGAGCFQIKKCKLLNDFFLTLNFNSVSIRSDLHGAAISLYGDSNGKLAILGTGSVLFDWEGKEITNIIGGRGHITGDEGSGYYFGKLILEAYQNRKLNKKQQRIVEHLNMESIDLANKFQVAKIAKQLKSQQDIFQDFHIDNIQSFINTHQLKDQHEKLSIVGSYGFHHKRIIRSVFEQNGIEILTFIEKPIFNLVEQRGVFID